MKGIINSRGYLEIERAGEIGPQMCPFTINHESELTPCGDWCPHFSEPSIMYTGVDQETKEDIEGYEIEICHDKVLTFTELDDQRGQEPEEEKDTAYASCAMVCYDCQTTFDIIKGQPLRCLSCQGKNISIPE